MARGRVEALKEGPSEMIQTWDMGAVVIGGQRFGVLPIGADLKVETIGPRPGGAPSREPLTFECSVEVDGDRVDAFAFSALFDLMPRAAPPPVRLTWTDRGGVVHSMPAHLGAMKVRKLYRGRPGPGQWSDRARKRRSRRLARSAGRRGVPYVPPLVRAPRFGRGAVATIEARAA